VRVVAMPPPPAFYVRPRVMNPPSNETIAAASAIGKRAVDVDHWTHADVI
jgi:hypothetical protein